MRRPTHVLVVSAVLRVSGLATRTPIWLTRPACSSEAQLAAAAPLQMLPPRRLQETHLDGRGRPTTGKCLPYALLLQSQRLSGSDVPAGTDMRTIDAFRDRVLDFAIANQAAPWQRADSEYGTLGDVVAAVMQTRGWGPTRPRSLAVRAWAGVRARAR
jgi:hypothetical protein